MDDATIKLEFYLRPKLRRLAFRLKNCHVSADKDAACHAILNQDSTPDDIRLLLHFYRTAKTYSDTALYVNGRIASKQQADSIIRALQCRANNIYDQPGYCNIASGLPGWSCKCLHAVQRHIAFGVHRGIEWYRVGPFQDGIQYIDKHEIKTVLSAEAESKALSLCPNFSLKKALAFVDRLPDQIDPRTDHEWTYSELPNEKGSPYGVEPKESLVLKMDF